MDFEYCVSYCITVVEDVLEDEYAPDWVRAFCMLNPIKILLRRIQALGPYDALIYEQIDLILDYKVSDFRLENVQRRLLNFKKNKPVIRDFKTCADSLMVGLNR